MAKAGGLKRDIKYKCSVCGAEKKREPGKHVEGLTIKRVQFAQIGYKGRLLRSRTIGWLCDPCRESDEDWNRTRLDTPGFADAHRNGGDDG